MSRYVKIKCPNCNAFTFWDGASGVSSTLAMINNVQTIGCRSCNRSINVTELLDKLFTFRGKTQEEIDEKWWKWIELQGYEVIIDK